MTILPRGPGELSEYAHRLTNLRTDRNRTHHPNQLEQRAPLKPLLLVAAMNVIAQAGLVRSLVIVQKWLSDFLGGSYSLKDGRLFRYIGSPARGGPPP